MTSQKHFSYSANRDITLLEYCFSKECDIDPLILRARSLYGNNKKKLALAIEQEMGPLI